MSRRKTIQSERRNNPLSLGFTGNDVDDAKLMNSKETGRTRNIESITNTQLWDLIDTDEYGVLLPAQKRVVDILLDMRSIIIKPGSKTRSDILSIFADGSKTRSALLTVTTTPISRAEELGLGKVYSRDFK
jgi:hypothetical protein